MYTQSRALANRTKENTPPQRSRPHYHTGIVFELEGDSDDMPSDVDRHGET